MSNVSAAPCSNTVYQFPKRDKVLLVEIVFIALLLVGLNCNILQIIFDLFFLPHHGFRRQISLQIFFDNLKMTFFKLN